MLFSKSFAWFRASNELRYSKTRKLKILIDFELEINKLFYSLAVIYITFDKNI